MARPYFGSVDPRVVNPDRLRDAARRRLPRQVFDYLDGGAEDERTLAANRVAFDRWCFAPRVLRDVAERSTTVELLGHDLALPVLVAPTAAHRLVDPVHGELATARAAAAAGTLFVASMASTVDLVDIGRAAPGRCWFQCYLSSRADLEVIIDRAQAGSYSALVLTVDTPVPGQRERDVFNRFAFPAHVDWRNVHEYACRPRWWWRYRRSPPVQNVNLRHVADPLTLINPEVTWDDVEWLRGAWSGPLVLKGIVEAEDARRAVAAGVDAVIVSNHGGRQLDGQPGTLDQLPAVVDAVAGAVPVLLDGGVRRGSDVVKALALGARATLVGRPSLYALAVGGEDGVRALLEQLRREVDRCLALIGRPSVANLDPSALRRVPG